MAVFAMGVVAVAAASAFENLVSKPFPQKFTAGQTAKHVFTVEGKKVECNKATFIGEAKVEKQKEVEVSPEYKECTAFGFVNSTVTMNGCKYMLRIVNGTTEGEVDIVNCNAGKKIEIAVSNGAGCLMTVGEQAKLKKETFANVKGKNGRNSVEVKIAVKAIAGESNGKGIGCPKAGAQKGEYTGSSVAEGETGTLEVV